MLFEEMFFNQQNKSYRVLCISQPLGVLTGKFFVFILMDAGSYSKLFFVSLVSARHSGNLQLGLGLGLGSVVWLWQCQELFSATTMNDGPSEWQTRTVSFSALMIFVGQLEGHLSCMKLVATVTKDSSSRNRRCL